MEFAQLEKRVAAAFDKSIIDLIEVFIGLLRQKLQLICFKGGIQKL